MANDTSTETVVAAEDEYIPSGEELEMSGGTPPRKAKHFWPSVKRLFGLMASEKKGMIVVVALVVGSVVLTVIAPKVLGKAMDVVYSGVIGAQLPAGANIDDIIAGARAEGRDDFADMLATADVVPGQGIDFTALGQIIIAVLLMYLVASMLMWAQGYILNALVMRVVYRLREDIERKINRLPLRYFDTRQRGDVMSRVTNDVDNIQQALQQAFSQLVQSALTIIGIGVMMFIVSWQLALLALIALPLSAIIAGVIGTRSQKLFKAQWKHTGDVNGHVEESFSGLDIVRAFGRDEVMLEEFDRRNESLYKASAGAQFVSGMIMPSMQFVSYLSYVLIAVAGGLKVATGQMTLGDATAFIQYSREFSQPISEMAGVANMLQSGVASAERTFELLDAEEENPARCTRSCPPHLEGRIQVSFRYAPRRRSSKGVLHRRTRTYGGDRRSHRRRKDHPGQPRHALLRDHGWNHLPRWHRHPRPQPRRPPLACGHGVQDAWLFEARSPTTSATGGWVPPMRKSSRLPRRRWSTGSCASCPTAMTPSSIPTAEASRPASDSSSQSPEPSSPTPHCSSSTRRPPRSTPAPRCSCSRRWQHCGPIGRRSSSPTGCRRSVTLTPSS